MLRITKQGGSGREASRDWKGRHRETSLQAAGLASGLLGKNLHELVFLIRRDVHTLRLIILYLFMNRVHLEVFTNWNFFTSTSRL